MRSNRDDYQAGRRLRPLLVAISAGIALLAALPSSALGSTVSSNGSSTITYTGAGTENNDVTIEPTGTPGTYTITDPGAAITATPPFCTGGGAAGVPASCGASALTSVVVNLNEGTDSSDTSEMPASVSSTISGGNGNDTELRTGAGADSINGGAGNDGPFIGGLGADNFVGGDVTLGDGIDEVSYSDAGATSVVADPDDNNDDGRDTNADGTADEGDTIDDDIENLTGGNGNDRLTGSNSLANGNNVLAGAGGNDQLNGLLGNDTLLGGAGDDAYNGGGDVDTASFAASPAGVTADLDTGGGTGTATGEGTDTLSEIENLTGSPQGDSLTGNAGPNVMAGGDGADLLFGEAGTDTVHGDGGDDSVNGGADSDSGGSAGVFGDAGDDTLNGNAGDDALDGGANGSAGDTASFAGAPGGVTASLASGTASGDGSDTLAALENLSGTDFADNLAGDANANTLSGGGDVDTLSGDDGSDTVNGEAGNDSLSGGPGNDSGGTAGLFGGDGDDTLNGNAGDDTLNGGPNGATGDSASFAGAPGGVTASLASGTATGDGSDTLAAVENLSGTDFADNLTGDANNNALTGLGLDDTLTGGDGNDLANGDSGADTLRGNNNDDTLNGGTEADNARGGSGNDAVNGGDGDEQGAGVVNGGPGDDTVSGGTGNDLVEGDDGNDSLSGNAGNDTLAGGNDTDTGNYAGAAAGVTASLQAGTASVDGDGGADTLIDLENLNGSGLGDNLTGKSGQANTLNGNAGNDTLSVRDDGPDTVNCGDGTDTALVDAADTVNPDCETADPPGPPAAPTITDTDPDSPANDNNPEVKGTVGSGSPTEVRIYKNNPTCAGAADHTGTAAQFTGSGITISVPDDSATELRATAVDAEGNESGCSAPFTYVEDSTAPEAPTITDTDPDSPANDNSPEVKGTTGAGSPTTVRIYENNPTCAGTADHTGTVADFTGAGITISVPDDSSTELRATAVDAAGNQSTCSTSFTYVEDSSAPAGPTITDTDPDSPANDNDPEVKGTTGAGSPTAVRIYKDNPTCTGTPDATGTPAQFSGAGITVSVPDDSTTALRATTVDSLGNESGCSPAFTYVEVTTPPDEGGDTSPPETTILDPIKKTRDKTPTYELASSEPGSSFECRVDDDPFAPCTSPHTTEKLKRGKHEFDVRATDPAGNTDQTPAEDPFKVKGKRKKGQK
jgi:Ca2+-binding RTX toxin-like protein